MLEKQFRGYYELASRQQGITGENLLRLLESRLDNVVYRLGFAASRDEARQMVRHRHFLVNGRSACTSRRTASVPATPSRSATRRKDLTVVKAALISSAAIEVPGWLEVDVEKLSGQGALAAAARPDRLPRPRAAHRRAVLEVGRRDRKPRRLKYMTEFMRPQVSVDKIDERTARYVVEPLERGFGYTLGNCMRRVLLSSLQGAAATSIRIEGVQHEFSAIEGVREDVTDIVLNVKGLVFRETGIGEATPSPRSPRAVPATVTGADLQVPSEFELVNPDQVDRDAQQGRASSR